MIKIKSSYLNTLVQYLRTLFSKHDTIMCVTVDSDGHEYQKMACTNDEKYSFLHGFPVLYKMYDIMGLRGKVTWFINIGYELEGEYKEDVKEIINRGDGIGLHIHADSEIQTDSSELPAIISEGYERLSAFARENGYDEKINSFRAGNLIRSELLFNILKQNNIEIDSTLSHSLVFKKLDVQYDDRKIPDSCYDLDLTNYKLSNVSKKDLFEIPVSQPIPNLSSEVIHPSPQIHSILIHPFNVVKTNGKLDYIRSSVHLLILFLLKINRGVSFATVDHAYEIYRRRQSERYEKIRFIVGLDKNEIRQLHEHRFSGLVKENEHIKQERMQELLNAGIVEEKSSVVRPTKLARKVIYHLTEYLSASGNNLLRNSFSDEFLSNKTVLDLGGGCGGQLLRLNTHRSKLFVVDNDYEALEVGETLLQKSPNSHDNQYYFNLSSGYKTGYEDKSFDIIVLRLSINYMPVKKTLNEVKRILKDDGVLVVKFHTSSHYKKYIRKLVDSRMYLKSIYFSFVILNGLLAQYLGGQIRFKLLGKSISELSLSVSFMEKWCKENGFSIKVEDPEVTTPVAIMRPIEK